MFDPNQPMEMGGGQDFQTMQQKAVQQRMLADYLRKQAGQQQQPQGNMVGQGPGARFVAPNVLQRLAAIAPQLNSAMGESAASEAEKQLTGATSQASQQWQSQLPQARAALPGPQAEGGSPELDAQPVTSDQVLRHTLAGMRIPGNEKNAALYNQTAQATLTREDTQAARMEERTARIAAEAARNKEALEQKAEAAMIRSEDARLSIEQRREAAREANASRLQIAQLVKEVGMARVAASGTAKVKGLSDKARSDLDAQDSMETGLRDGVVALEKASGSGMGWLAGAIQNLIPGGQSVVSKGRSDATNSAIQMLTYTTDEIRHGRFGSALTASEKASAAQYLPSEYDDRNQTLAKARGLEALVAKNRARLKAQEELLSGGDAPAAPTAPTGPVRVKTLDEAKALDPGTKFLDPNGVLRTR